MFRCKVCGGLVKQTTEFRPLPDGKRSEVRVTGLQCGSCGRPANVGPNQLGRASTSNIVCTKHRLRVCRECQVYA